MSPRTIYLSRLIGLFMLVFAASMIIDKPRAIEMVTALVHDRSALAIIGVLASAAGIAIVLAHQVWRGGAGLYLTVHGFLGSADGRRVGAPCGLLSGTRGTNVTNAGGLPVAPVAALPSAPPASAADEAEPFSGVEPFHDPSNWRARRGFHRCTAELRTRSESTRLRSVRAAFGAELATPRWTEILVSHLYPVGLMFDRSNRTTRRLTV